METKLSPNFSKGRSGRKVELVIIHIMEGSLKGTDSWFANRGSAVSAHYGIGMNGEVHQYVKEEDTAWHAGRVLSPTYRLYKAGVNPNLVSIGIEHEGTTKTVWTEATKQASANLIREICTRWNIPIDRDHIIGHNQVYSLKTCPGNLAIVDELVSRAKGNVTLEDRVKKLEDQVRALEGK